MKNYCITIKGLKFTKTSINAVIGKISATFILNQNFYQILISNQNYALNSDFKFKSIFKMIVNHASQNRSCHYSNVQQNRLEGVKIVIFRALWLKNGTLHNSEQLLWLALRSNWLELFSQAFRVAQNGGKQKYFFIFIPTENQKIQNMISSQNRIRALKIDFESKWKISYTISNHDINSSPTCLNGKPSHICQWCCLIISELIYIGKNNNDRHRSNREVSF